MKNQPVEAPDASPDADRTHPGTVPLKPLLAIVLVLSLGVFLYTSVFTTVQVHAVTQPDALLAVAGSSVELRIEAVNRLGWRVPFAAPRLRCEVLEGAELVTLRSATDSTMVIVESNGIPGSVELRVFTPASLFPLSVRVPVLVPLA
ncbi:MAG: hypothetical protein IPP94_03240 [Ignavibacteria bacterium]|nr:hypothetical protein [Ignavibacteria bacterium]